jgi:uncharacterized membrane protein (DUF441 family)
MNITYILLGALVVAVIGKANSVAMALGILLVIKLAHVEGAVYPILQKEGMFWGLVLLIAAIMVPIAKGEYNYQQLGSAFTSRLGILAFLLSLLTTYLSGLGLYFLTVQQHSEIMPALILGSVVAAAFMGGVPVGPLITSGLLQGQYL